MKNYQFLSSIKRDAHKRKLVPFFCLTMHAHTDHVQKGTWTNTNRLLDFGSLKKLELIKHTEKNHAYTKSHHCNYLVQIG